MCNIKYKKTKNKQSDLHLKNIKIHIITHE